MEGAARRLSFVSRTRTLLGYVLPDEEFRPLRHLYGTATRYTLFQQQNEHTVCCTLYIKQGGSKRLPRGLKQARIHQPS